MSEQRAMRAFTESQRDALVKTALTRFQRSRSLPSDLEDLRYRLIRARVLSGLLATEAAARFGYANSTQLSQIESGKRSTPSDWKFLRQAAEVYSVSVDWLLGLSPDWEPDSRIVREHALLRGSENMVRGFVSQMATAIVQTARETNVVEEELARLLEDVDTMTARFAKYAAREEFQDVPGVAPLRAKLTKLQAVEAILAELKAGNAVPSERFKEFFDERDLESRASYPASQ